MVSSRTTKRCTCCGDELLLADFHCCVSNPDGFQSACKRCQKVRQRLCRTKTLETRKQHRQTNRKKYQKARREFRAIHLEAERQRSRDWREKNPEKHAAATASWKRRNRSRVRNHNAQRRARLAGVPGKFTLEEWEAKKAEYGNRCAYCGKQRKLTRHHIIPLTKRAASSNTIENIAPACRSCNSTIQDKIIQPKEVCCA